MNNSKSNNYEIKFLVDAMLGKLARFLRIFGYDTVYANDLEDIFHLSPLPDEKLRDYARENNCIILTKDYEFFRTLKDKCIYLEGVGVYNYLRQLRYKLNLNYSFKMENARCSICNSRLERVKDKKSLANEVLNETYRNYDEFYQCTNSKCKKVFWKGTHIIDIVQKLKKLNIPY
ncbi:MAG: DUF5615 family PIN-like protein [Candidatus Thorarchaeota archaeon]